MFAQPGAQKRSEHERFTQEGNHLTQTPLCRDTKGTQICGTDFPLCMYAKFKSLTYLLLKSKTLLNTGLQLFKEFTSAFAHGEEIEELSLAETTSSPPATPPLKVHEIDVPPTPTPNRASPFTRRKKIKMTPRPELESKFKTQLHITPNVLILELDLENEEVSAQMDSFFHHPSDLENGPFVMEIKVTPPSADNTPPTSPVRQSNYSQPFLPTPRCNIVCYSPSAFIFSCLTCCVTSCTEPLFS